MWASHKTPKPLKPFGPNYSPYYGQCHWVQSDKYILVLYFYFLKLLSIDIKLKFLKAMWYVSKSACSMMQNFIMGMEKALHLGSYKYNGKYESVSGYSRKGWLKKLVNKKFAHAYQVSGFIFIFFFSFFFSNL